LKKKVSSWGCLTSDLHDVKKINDLSSYNSIFDGVSQGIVFGNGRSYGDICLNPEGELWESSKLNKFINFDKNSGILTCESGVLIKDINEIFISQGWMLPVTAGTQFITIGGSIANDIHGKNHHVFGSFGNHICSLDILRSDGQIFHCEPNNNTGLFHATIGGMGLTGIILSARIQLRKVTGSYVECENIPYESLDEFFSIALESEDNWEHTVSWLDCTSSNLGRGIFTRGNFIENQSNDRRKKINLNIPFKPPISLINKVSLNVFNKSYFNIKKRGNKNFNQHYQSFLYPLDNILNWNRIYGPNGFYQYQSVIPKDNAFDATKEMLNEIKSSGEGSFLAVLKTFGKKNSIGMLSFPMEGVTLALDFPNRKNKTSQLFNRLDDIVKEASGRVYLAKDARMSSSFFKETYPNYNEFLNLVDKKFSSSMSKRLLDI
jgi:FAD/FMN-containing dehydrogenase|tara:strand:+ start:6059 stop:7360 length:1302 start_codon:yes stop_codon:yes gene_type:complete